MRRKRIFVDGLALVDGHFSGVGQYVLGLLKGIDTLAGEAYYAGEKFPEVFVIIPFDKIGRFDSFEFKFIKSKRFPLPFRVMAGLWHRNKLPPIDLFLGSGTYLFPRFADMRLINPRNKSALVIYDLSYELYRQYSDEGNAIFLSNAVKRSLHRASCVITISQNAKKEILDYYKLDPSSVFIATPATDPAIFYHRSEDQIDEAKRKYGISGDYILALSNLEPRKNLETLVRAYCALPAKKRENLSLLLVGVSGWKTDGLFSEIIERVKEGYAIIRPSSYISDLDKPAILSGATMLVYPSHYEGFGMPPLEAMACGTPVITADNSSLPEVMGDIGKMIPSNDTDRLKHAIEEYLNKHESIKKTFRVEGPKRADLFSWKQSAAHVIKALGDI